MHISLSHERWGMDRWWVKMMSYSFGSHLSTGEFYAFLTQKQSGGGQWRWTSLTSSSAPSGQNALTKSGWKDSKKGENELGSFLGRSSKRTVAFPCFDDLTINLFIIYYHRTILQIIYSWVNIQTQLSQHQHPLLSWQHRLHATSLANITASLAEKKCFHSFSCVSTVPVCPYNPLSSCGLREVELETGWQISFISDVWASSWDLLQADEYQMGDVTFCDCSRTLHYQECHVFSGSFFPVNNGPGPKRRFAWLWKWGTLVGAWRRRFWPKLS